MNLLDILSGVGYALDTPGAYTRGALAGKPGERKSGRELLESLGLVGAEEGKWDAGDFGGFAAEMALDPLNLVGGGMLKKLLGTAGKAKKANALSDALRASGGMPEELVAKLHPSMLDEAGQPIKWKHGTPHVFDKFDMDKAAEGSLMDKGIYFTRDGELASEYTDKGAMDFYGRKANVRDEDVAMAYRNALEGYDTEMLGDYRSKYPDGPHDSWNPPPNTPEAVAEYTRKADSLYQGITPDPTGMRNKEFGTKAMRTIMGALEPHYEPHFAPRNVRQHYLDVRNPLDADAMYPVPGEMFEDLRKVGVVEQPFDHVYGRDMLAWRRQLHGDSFPEQLKKMGHDAIQHEGGHRMGGGQRLHDVTVVQDPSQVYSPWIAPKKKRVPKASPLLGALLGHNALARGGDR